MNKSTADIWNLKNKLAARAKRQGKAVSNKFGTTYKGRYGVWITRIMGEFDHRPESEQIQVFNSIR